MSFQGQSHGSINLTEQDYFAARGLQHFELNFTNSGVVEVFCRQRLLELTAYLRLESLITCLVTVQWFRGRRPAKKNSLIA